MTSQSPYVVAADAHWKLYVAYAMLALRLNRKGETQLAEVMYSLAETEFQLSQAYNRKEFTQSSLRKLTGLHPSANKELKYSGETPSNKGEERKIE